MAKTDIWMPIFIGDYLKDTRHLTTEEHGAYYLILLELWNKEGFLPIDTIHRIALKPRDKFAEIWKNISSFFTEKDGIISQKRLLKEYKLSKKRRKVYKINGLKGGRPKTNGLTNGLPIANLRGNPSITSSPSPSPSKENTYKEEINTIIAYLNLKASKAFKPSTPETIKNISGRLNDGNTIEDFKKVIDIKVSHWKEDKEYNSYLRPSTLFKPTNFESYLNQEIKRKPVFNV